MPAKVLNRLLLNHQNLYMKTTVLSFLLLLSATTYAQTAANDMFRVTVQGEWITFEALQPCPEVIEGSIGTKLFDTSFTLNGTVTFKLREDMAGQTLRLRTHTKCMQKANSSWVSFVIAGILGLPVKVHHFSAFANKNSVELRYYVEATEGDNFEIQRSSDGIRWETLLTSVNASGNAYTGIRKLVDFSTTENNYYRIKIYEAGRISYSKVLHVKVGVDNSEVMIYNWNGTPIKKTTKQNLSQALRSLRPGSYPTSVGVVAWRL